MSNRLLFIKKCYNLAQLMRINQPIGFFLLLWPTLWGLWLSHKGIPDKVVLIVFVVGAFCMRSAGCIINDYVDYDIDSHVQRTKTRPLSSGMITKKEALVVLAILLFIAFILVLSLNFITIFLSAVALILSWIYPYLKRYTYFPQVMLGILFSWPILMAFTAINNPINSTACLLFLMNTVWTIVYDTQYAMIDREDDIYVGIKSSAVLFGDMDKFLIGILQLCIVFILGIIGWKERFTVEFYFFSLFGVIILFMWQQILINKRKRIRYFQAFLSNNYVGMLVFIGIASSFY
ncbi:4-hydroxybenzoate octaprenyltransferase [Candidatus Blochmanniella camponoti]|uniref:4-hydroxybenzoate octaprenyltransferase n=1 Tax=Candidatus Blochmanniella camponoti TaxID=108080 RepID=A0AAE9L5T1_9ENTR|nr:4-hydroxybenzoate octaprenyltransferase [Candidatus Blochmannia herculeanus]URJ24474.1 4-hydroxybenzoate octaprenyltransferase [Candidatus Blochmannia herculeanus]URJ26918.1 4-hydroxybenzoate octaprenyltransferase [Candidatus Blochmannia herculeanus]URJ27279.1 4-hydroxybenzoate octaprenyltransferase [Candidatus Blochmannia herculeanus]